MLHNLNPFIGLYKMAKERLAEQGSQDQDMRIMINPQLRLIVEVGADRRRYNCNGGVLARWSCLHATV